MHIRIVSAAVIALCLTASAPARSGNFDSPEGLIVTSEPTGDDTIPPFKASELSVGLGAAVSMEDDIFNVPNDVGGGTNFGVSLRYLKNLDDHFAVGVDLYGFFKSIDNAMVVANGSSGNYTLSVDVVNFGAVGRYAFGRGELQPYVIALLSYTTGSLSNDALGRLRLSGFSGGGGAGLNIGLGASFALSFEGFASIGTAKWDQPPFTNSSGTDFNPSMFMMLARFSYLWE